MFPDQMNVTLYILRFLKMCWGEKQKLDPASELDLGNDASEGQLKLATVDSETGQVMLSVKMEAGIFAMLYYYTYIVI